MAGFCRTPCEVSLIDWIVRLCAIRVMDGGPAGF